MINLGGGGGDSAFTYRMLLFSVSIMVLLSLLIPIYCPKVMPSDGDPLTIDKINEQYADFTGTQPTSEAVWGLTGIYTPYGVDKDGNVSSAWGRTEDGWLYGQRVVNYIPSQYSTDTAGYQATYDDTVGLYYYTNDSTVNNIHAAGDLYGSVVMCKNHQSNMFFSSAGKVSQGDTSFYYKFSGYRYAFSPLASYKTVDNDGNVKDVVPNTTSLSLIWYNYYGENNGPGTTGIAGQLILSGSDSGVAYLTAAQIVSAFNSDTSTSKFIMTFNGVDMNIYIRLDPTKLTAGLTVEECYNLGYWSIMVSSRSVNTAAYASADYEFSPTAIFQTMIDLFTFNMSDYGLTGMVGILASLMVTIPLLLALVSLGMNNYLIVMLMGIWAGISALAHNGVFNLFG